MTIAFIHPHKAFLPEIAAYTTFFNSYTIQTIILSSQTPLPPKPGAPPPESPSLNADVEWYFMGRGGKKKNHGIVIHEYPSASTPPLGALKDSIKRLATPKPDYRLFQNEYVAGSFRFKDGIPFGIRQHGFTPVTGPSNSPQSKPYDFSPRVPHDFSSHTPDDFSPRVPHDFSSHTPDDFSPRVPHDFSSHTPDDFSPRVPHDFNGTKSYDFIYIGTVDKARQLDSLFAQFTSGPLKAHTLLVLSKDYQALQKELGAPANIHFRGPVPPGEVPGYIRQASYGINFIPDKAPFNQQPSGKFLDYCSCAVPVITTDYPWIRDFQRQAGGAYYFLQPDLSNFSWDEITRFDYHAPNLSGWSWDEQIRQSGVLEFLQSRFPELSF